MFQTKVVEEIKTNILCPIIFFSENCAVFLYNFEKYFRAGQDTYDNMANARAWWVTRAADAHSKYVVLIASLQQQWPAERATLPVLFQ
jgi:hypothetical protein